MPLETITAEAVLRDIYEAEATLRWYEQKYGLLSETFYSFYQQGLLRDEEPLEIQEYLEWSGWYEIYLDRRQRYDRAIRQRLNTLAVPASLQDLHFSQLPMSA